MSRSTPSNSIDAKSIAYDTDIVETLVVSGSVIFIAALADDDRSSRAMKSPGFVEVRARHAAARSPRRQSTIAVT